MLEAKQGRGVPHPVSRSAGYTWTLPPLHLRCGPSCEMMQQRAAEGGVSGRPGIERCADIEAVDTASSSCVMKQSQLEADHTPVAVATSLSLLQPVVPRCCAACAGTHFWYGRGRRC